MLHALLPSEHFLQHFRKVDLGPSGAITLLPLASHAADLTLDVQGLDARRLQGAQLVPSQFVEMIPYVLTIVALAGVVGRATPPAALGKQGA